MRSDGRRFDLVFPEGQATPDLGSIADMLSVQNKYFNPQRREPDNVIRMGRRISPWEAVYAAFSRTLLNPPVQ